VPESVLVADLEAEAALLRSLCQDPPGPPDRAWLERVAAAATAALSSAPL